MPAVVVPIERLDQDAGSLQYRADVEYNHANDGRLKTMAGENFETVTGTRRDLILHSRGRVADQQHHSRRDEATLSSSGQEAQGSGETRQPYESVWPVDDRVDPAHVRDYRLGYFVEIDEPRQSLLVHEYVRGEVSRTEQLNF